MIKTIGGSAMVRRGRSEAADILFIDVIALQDTQGQRMVSMPLVDRKGRMLLQFQNAFTETKEFRVAVSATTGPRGRMKIRRLLCAPH